MAVACENLFVEVDYGVLFWTADLRSSMRLPLILGCTRLLPQLCQPI